MRIIDADALKEYVKIFDIGCGCDDDHHERFLDAIDDAPTIESELETGEWERHYSRPNVYADLYWHCSKCGYKNDNQYANVYHNFCPNCGADMKGELNETDVFKVWM